MSQLAEHRVVGEGPSTLLFLHGLGGDWTNWQPQLDAFADSHRCISWTMPGFGDSPSLDDLNWSSLADAAVALLNNAGAATATVVGLSMGGYVAQQLAFDHPERVDGLVLVATSATFGRPGDEEFKDRFLAMRQAPLDDGKTPADLAPVVVDALLGPEPAEGARDNCIASMSRISVEAYRRALDCLVTWDGRAGLPGLEAPTLCVAGDHDRTAPVKSLDRLTGSIAGAHLEVIESCGHLVNLEQPEAFNAALRSFVNP